ncbi:hypothetical protein PCAR4_530012 [Paraburkholderia caribensis]|nr:hypothetical protein PCAR4_530012 [Paraburkholderia caribensis]
MMDGTTGHGPDDLISQKFQASARQFAPLRQVSKGAKVGNPITTGFCFAPERHEGRHPACSLEIKRRRKKIAARKRLFAKTAKWER